MGCRILHDLGASPSSGGPSDHLGSSWSVPGSWWALVSFWFRCRENCLLLLLPMRLELALGFVEGFGVWGFLGVWGVSLDGVVVLRSCVSCRCLSL